MLHYFCIKKSRKAKIINMRTSQGRLSVFCLGVGVACVVCLELLITIVHC